ncbi:aftiphilin isoform X2 [Myripristis murdjan]|uniref:aftiphilin isoform X2 n=1 Tax=Myripristis murdjan TaxID=586833 RepID=UPI0011762472|nr:aftiphilin isoform X2 [Myripristis murdjan]
MEPDVMPMHSSSPPPLDNGGAEEDEFGDYGDFSLGVSCSTLAFTDFTEPPFSLRQPSPPTEPATQSPNSSFNHQVEQSQPTSTVKSGFSSCEVDVKGQHCNVEPPSHLTNGCLERNHASEHLASGTQTASVPIACSPTEETGFADFTAFSEQAAPHPWCCGFSAMGGPEHWDGRAGKTNLASSLGEQLCDSGQEIIMESEPCTSKAKANDCTMVKHCEQKDAAPIQPSQDHQPQEPVAALAFPPEEPHPGEEELGIPGESQRGRTPSTSLNTNHSQTSESEDGEESVSPPHITSLYKSVSQDFGSLCDIVSPERPSEDFDPSCSCPAPHEDKTDDEEEEEDEFGIYRRTDSLANLSLAQPDPEEAPHHHGQSESANQENSATSSPLKSGTSTKDGLDNFKESRLAHHSHQDHDQTVDAGEQGVGSLPPSDSFADFCSAPIEGHGEGCWDEFRDQGPHTEEKTWAQFNEEGRTVQTDGNTERDTWGQDGAANRDGLQASLSCRVQRLLQASFPEVVVQTVEDEEGVPSLSAVFQAQHRAEDRGEERPRQQQLCTRLQWVHCGTWWQHQDAVGLQFWWGGSHTNRTLLGCLGVDTRNIVFTGLRKQPVVVPAFASSLGMLEPTKESVPAVSSPRRTVVTAQGPPGLQDSQGPSADSVQEALPPSQLDWSSSGLTNSQDAQAPLHSTWIILVLWRTVGPAAAAAATALHQVSRVTLHCRNVHPLRKRFSTWDLGTHRGS